MTPIIVPMLINTEDRRERCKVCGQVIEHYPPLSRAEKIIFPVLLVAFMAFILWSIFTVSDWMLFSTNKTLVEVIKEHGEMVIDLFGRIF